MIKNFKYLFMIIVVTIMMTMLCSITADAMQEATGQVADGTSFAGFANVAGYKDTTSFTNGTMVKADTLVIDAIILAIPHNETGAAGIAKDTADVNTTGQCINAIDEANGANNGCTTTAVKKNFSGQTGFTGFAGFMITSDPTVVNTGEQNGIGINTLDGTTGLTENSNAMWIINDVISDGQIIVNGEALEEIGADFKNVANVTKVNGQLTEETRSLMEATGATDRDVTEAQNTLAIVDEMNPADVSITGFITS